MNRPHTVLLVDSDPFFRRVYGSRLQKAGYELLVARDAVEGSKLAGQHLPSAILCDVHTDNGRGLELVQALGSSPKTSHIPVLCLSNTWQDEHKNAAFKAGAKGFLQ